MMSIVRNFFASKSYGSISFQCHSERLIQSVKWQKLD